MFPLRSLLPIAMAAAAVAGCATSTADNQPYTYPESDAEVGNDASPDSSPPPQDGGFDALTVDVQTSDVEQVDDTLMYVHDKATLYTVDPKDPKLTLTTVGDFDCVGETPLEPSMTDLAVDKDGKLYGVSSKAVFLDMQVDTLGKMVNCQAGKRMIDTSTAGDARFYGLTVAPPTASLGTEETLIGVNTVGELYAINKTSGSLTLVGRFGAVPADDGNGHAYDPSHVGQPWGLSGDLVFFSNEGNPVGFATLRDCEDPAQGPNTCSTVDTLVEIDVTKLAPAGVGGAPIVTKSIRGRVWPQGCTSESCGFGAMYGITAYQDKVYGFSYGGHIVSIDNATGLAELISSPLVQPGFTGAGVTTAARIIAPQPK